MLYNRSQWFRKDPVGQTHSTTSLTSVRSSGGCEQETGKKFSHGRSLSPGALIMRQLELRTSEPRLTPDIGLRSHSLVTDGTWSARYSINRRPLPNRVHTGPGLYWTQVHDNAPPLNRVSNLPTPHLVHITGHHHMHS